MWIIAEDVRWLMADGRCKKLFMVQGSGFMVKDFKIYNQKTYFIS